MADSTTAQRSLIGTESYRTPEGKRPENYRETVSHLWPNGRIPVVGMTQNMKNRKVDDPMFHWFEKIYPKRGGDVTTLEDTGGTEISSNGAKGDEWRVIVKADVSQHFRSGHQALLKNKDEATFSDHTQAKVLSVQDLGDNSVITIRLLETDNGIGSSYDDDDDISIFVSGSINAEGAQMPDTVTYVERRMTNRTQIFRYPLLRTRTALRTRLRTGDDYKEAKREALELHYADMEMAFWFGIQSENFDTSNGQPEGTTRGIIRSIDAYSPDENIIDFHTWGSAGNSWADYGRKFLDQSLEILFRWGDERKVGVCGRKALLGIQELVHTSQIAQYNISRTTNEYGMDILRWYTPFGTLDLRTHSLFSRNNIANNSIVVIEPDKFEYCYIDDTFYAKDPNSGSFNQGGPLRIDGLAEEFVTEAGLAHKHMESMGMIHNVGTDIPGG